MIHVYRKLFTAHRHKNKNRMEILKMFFRAVFIYGANEGTRTPDLLITNQLRYQLRHISVPTSLSLYIKVKKNAR